MSGPGFTPVGTGDRLPVFLFFMIFTRLDPGSSDARDIAISYVSAENTPNTHDITMDVFCLR